MDGNETDLCFECLGEASWCSACKKEIILPKDDRAKGEEQPAASNAHPDQLPLI